MFTLQSKSYDGRYLKLTCTQSQDVAANRSTVDWVLESVGGNSNYYYTGPTTVTIDGTQVYYRGRTGAHEFPCAKGSISGSLTLSHGADGQKTAQVSLKTAIYTKTPTEKTGTWTLDAIPRQADLTAAPNFTDEENPTISYKNPAGAAVTSLALCIALDEALTQALPYQAVSKTGTNFTYRLQEADRQFLWEAMGKNNSVEVCFCLRTVIGGVIFYDKLWRKVTLVNADPVLAPQVTESDPAVKAADPGAFIRYLSDAQFTVGAQGRKGATIVSQSVSCDSTVQKKASGTLSNIRSKKLLFSATDSRGNRTEYPLELPFVAYRKLTCSVGGSRPDTAGNFTLQISGLCYTGAIGKLGQNTLQAEYCYSTGGEYTQWLPMTVQPGDNAYTAAAEISGLDYRTTYTFCCRVKDRLMTVTTEEVPVKAMPVFDWGENDFHFHVPVRIQDSDLADFVVEQGVSGVWRYRKWNSGAAECWGNAAVTVPTELNKTGAVYYTTPVYVDYPFAITNARRLINIANVGIVNAQLTESHENKGSFRLVCATEDMAGKSVTVHLYTYGQWK